MLVDLFDHFQVRVAMPIWTADGDPIKSEKSSALQLHSLTLLNDLYEDPWTLPRVAHVTTIGMDSRLGDEEERVL